MTTLALILVLLLCGFALRLYDSLVMDANTRTGVTAVLLIVLVLWLFLGGPGVR